MTVKFVSLNMWLGGTFFDNILQFLGEQAADVIVLQEVYNGTDSSMATQYRSMQVLKECLGYPHDDFVADFRDFDRTGGKAQRGNAVLSKFPITARNAIFFAEPYSETYHDVPGNYEHCPRDLQHVALETPAGVLDIFNIQGILDYDGENYSEARKHMSEVVIQAVSGKRNVILAGDTNADQTNQAILDIEQHLHSVFGRDLPTTFNMRHKDNPGYATAAVDAIFVSPSIEILARNCSDADVSDHLALTATLRIPEQG